MPQTGRYIGTPNGIVLCVNSRNGENIEGELYHGYSKEGIPFIGYEEIIRIAEKLFNALGFPHMGTSDRDIDGHVKRRGDGKSFERRRNVSKPWGYGNVCHSCPAQAA